MASRRWLVDPQAVLNIFLRRVHYFGLYHDRIHLSFALVHSWDGLFWINQFFCWRNKSKFCQTQGWGVSVSHYWPNILHASLSPFFAFCLSIWVVFCCCLSISLICRSIARVSRLPVVEIMQFNIWNYLICSHFVCWGTSSRSLKSLWRRHSEQVSLSTTGLRSCDISLTCFLGSAFAAPNKPILFSEYLFIDSV